VGRGQEERRRVAHAACLVAIVALLASCGSSSSATSGAATSPSASPATTTSSPSPTTALAPTGVAMLAATRPLLTTWGWEVVSSAQLASAGTQTTELDLTIRKVSGSTGSPWVADGTETSLVLLLDPAGGDSALRYSSRCTPTTCKTRVDNPSCFNGVDCAQGGQSTPLTARVGVEVGSLITWGVSGRSGRAAEVVVGTDPARPDVPTSVLDDNAGYELISRFWHLPDS
jgi:hypothetical protein